MEDFVLASSVVDVPASAGFPSAGSALDPPALEGSALADQGFGDSARVTGSGVSGFALSAAPGRTDDGEGDAAGRTVGGADAALDGVAEPLDGAAEPEPDGLVVFASRGSGASLPAGFPPSVLPGAGAPERGASSRSAESGTGSGRLNASKGLTASGTTTGTAGMTGGV
ncbi:hypothetical protein ABGB17_37720 [Sphaerisporangium sp. B11E5]|uniref:hypothetical protein n=1 Tax=Sphaerisporangium sp. B11E5 TaxID=3153563 RepID=UPI00325F5EAB